MSIVLALFAAFLLLVASWPRRRSEVSATRAALLSAPLLDERRRALAQERLRLQAELDLLRGVFEASSALVGCIDAQDFRRRLAATLARYWAGERLELLEWEKGVWRGGEGAPPELDAPVVLPEGDGQPHLILDLSPGVAGRAALVLRQARPQPSLAGCSRDEQRTIAELLRGQFAIALRRIVLYQQLQDLARSDPLTGACRRWYGEARLAELVDGGAVVAVCVVDIDHFKRINDTYGHAAGDAVLAAVGKALIAQVRGDDLVVRLGGEEFLVILPETLPAGALTVAERLRQAVAALAGLPAPVTVSIGLACCHRDETAESLIARADAALYQAKQAGRNRVVSADAGDAAQVRAQAVPRSGTVTRAYYAAARAPRPPPAAPGS